MSVICKDNNYSYLRKRLRNFFISKPFIFDDFILYLHGKSNE